MMYNYPFFSFPYFRRYSTPAYTYSSKSSSFMPQNQNKNSSENSKKSYSKNYKIDSNDKKDSVSSSKPVSLSHYGLSFLDNFLNQQDRDKDETYFDLFGLKLYNDDLLLIGLIFFLYKEDVKDKYLFIALILLLLS